MSRRVLVAVALIAVLAAVLPASASARSPYRCNHGSKRWTAREVRCVIRVVFRHHAGLAEALRVAACESGYDPRAVSPTGDWGVFQINRAAHPDYFVGAWRWRHRFDPVYNARYALRMSDYGTRWSPWVCAWR